MGATTYNPIFIGKNFIRDVLEAAIQAKGVTPIYSSLKQMHHIARKDESYQAFLRSGASMGSFMELDDKELYVYAKQLFNAKEHGGIKALKALPRLIEHGMN